jgi:hypothetical protein
VLLGSALSAATLGAQEPVRSHPPHGFEPAPRWAGHFTVFSANALLSGALTGPLRQARGGSLSEGFVQGHGNVASSAGGDVRDGHRAVASTRQFVYRRIE